MNRMKFPSQLLPIFLLGAAAALAFAGNAAADSLKALDFGMNAGYRVDRLDWNTAGNSAGQAPNILSELKWKDLKIWQVGASGKMAVGNDIVDYRTYIRASLDYGWITDGSVRDSDYSGDNRTGIEKLSVSQSDADHVVDGSIGLGFEKDYWQNRLTLGWLGGYSYHELDLHLTNGIQYIPVYAVASDLDSTYKSKWYGPFAGIDIELRPFPRFSLLGSAEYHWADYEAQADWNLRKDLNHPLSFQQNANNAHGLVGTIRGSYAFTRRWLMDLSFNYRDFSARDGLHQVFLTGGSSTETRLNEANWKSYTTTLGINYSF